MTLVMPDQEPSPRLKDLDYLITRIGLPAVILAASMLIKYIPFLRHILK